MRVVSASLVLYRVPFRRPYETARGTATVREGLVLELQTDAGLVGLGESAPLPDEDADVEAFARAVREAVAGGLGRRVEDLRAEHQEHPPGREGVALETAVLDVVARSRGVPLAALLADGSHARRVAVNATVTHAEVEDVRMAGAEARNAGFSALKLKVGVLPVEDDVARVRAAREACGPGMRLRLDANGAWTEEQARRFLDEVAALEIEYVEQPLPPGDPAALRRLRRAVSVPVAADEDAATFDDAMRVLAEGAADVIVLKPLQVGITASLRVAGAAARKEVDITITSGVETGVGTAAALHVASALAATGRPPGAAGLATLPLLQSSLLVVAPEVEAGWMALPEGAGLGVALDETAVRRYALEEWRLGRL